MSEISITIIIKVKGRAEHNFDLNSRPMTTYYLEKGHSDKLVEIKK
jgi:hypothetical protein